ncbi:MAG TPA: hypothetical protein VII49_10765 [Rhizomicrobium sp.]
MRAKCVEARNALHTPKPKTAVTTSDRAMTVSVPAASTRPRPATSNASGIVTANCGLYASRPKRMPAASGRFSISASADASSAAVRKPLLPWVRLTKTAGKASASNSQWPRAGKGGTEAARNSNASAPRYSTNVASSQTASAAG